LTGGEAVIWHDAPVTRHFAHRGLAALLIATAAAMLSSCGGVSPARHPGYPTVAVTVGSRPTGRPLAPGFVGLSLEYFAVPAYADPQAIRLIGDLSPGQRPVIRIGGNSTDEAWWPQPGEAAPRGAKYALGSNWMSAAARLASALDARMILGLNLAAGQSAVAGDEARAFERSIGSRYIQGLEIGNEPDLYGLFPWPQEHGLRRRGPGYSLRDFIRQYSRWRSAIGPALPVIGPAYATFDWSLARFIDSEPSLSLVTFHHYPLDACLTKRSATGYPTIANLLSAQSSSGLAKQLAPAVAVAHAHGLPFRLDELNSASCGGKWGVSNTFASALWMLDTLFNLARVGVDGVNVHTFPGAAYAPFSASGVAYPEYYGMLMFARAFPPAARLLPVTVSPGGALKAWATIDAGMRIRLILINEDVTRSYVVKLHVRGLGGPRRLERLRAPSVGATRGVTLGGHQSVSPVDGVYSIAVPAASAVLTAP